MKTNLLILISAVILYPANVIATHNMSGQITFKHINGLTYEITLTTFTYAPSPADRPELEIHWGDGLTSIVFRQQVTNLDNDIRRNIYLGQHTYSHYSSYIISMEDPNRYYGILNIPNSVNVPLYIESMLYVFDPEEYCAVNSVNFFTNAPIIKQRDDDQFKFNLTAFDADQDSIAYELVSCKGSDGSDIPGYSIPEGVTLDPYTGEFRWGGPPPLQGPYCFAAKISKWRNGRKISYVIKDFMITVISYQFVSYSFTGTGSLLTDSHGNYFITLNPYDTLDLGITYSDVNSSHYPSINAYSELFLLNEPASFSSDGANHTVNGYVHWIPDSLAGRHRPYQLVFRGTSRTGQFEIANDLSVLIYVTGNNDTICPAFPIDYAIHDKEKIPEIIDLFPLPAKNTVWIRNHTAVPHTFYLTIISMEGRREVNEWINLTGTYPVDVSGLRKGIYLLILHNEAEKFVQKIVVNK